LPIEGVCGKNESGRNQKNCDLVDLEFEKDNESTEQNIREQNTKIEEQTNCKSK